MEENLIININEYSIIEKINSGGFGVVYSVQNNETKKKYAAKIIILTDSQKTIEREINIMTKIKHNTIVKFYGFSKTDFHGENNITILMDLYERGSLADILQKIQKGLTEKDYDNTCRQKMLIGIANGMMYLHQNKIIHRDLKPGNILLDDYLEPHITDFGLSKECFSNQYNDQTQCVGTLFYMAPEVINGNQYSFEADVYSFSILMYEVVTNQIPFEDVKPYGIFEFFSKIVNKKYRPEFTVPVKPSIRKLITDCWSPDPKKRPTFTEIFEKLSKNEDFYLENVDKNKVKNYLAKIGSKRIPKIHFNDYEQHLSLNIVFLGPPQANKTSIIHKYCYNNFKDNPPSYGAGYLAISRQIDNKEIYVRFWDTAGQEKYRSLCSPYLSIANGIVLVYDVNDEKSFDELDIFLKMFLDLVDVSSLPVMPVLVLGNNADNDDCAFDDKVKYWTKMNKIKHSYYVSAKTGSKIKESIELFLSDLLKTQSANKNTDEQPIQLDYESQNHSGWCNIQ